MPVSLCLATLPSLCMHHIYALPDRILVKCSKMVRMLQVLPRQMFNDRQPRGKGVLQRVIWEGPVSGRQQEVDNVSCSVVCLWLVLSVRYPGMPFAKRVISCLPVSHLHECESREYTRGCTRL